jgi:3-methyladenine DNA glycosylase Mpg
MEIDFTIHEDAIDTDFQRIANDLLNNWVLKVENVLYRITEIEFYYKDEDKKHDDSYIHGHVLQKQEGKWYFHGSGIDITFGSEGAYGGILIRAIYNIKDKEYCYGPLNCILEIFSNLSSIYDPEMSFCLIRASEKQIEFEKPICAPRVGLNPEKDPVMYNKYYRFLVMPKQKHADKTGIVEAMKNQKINESEIKNIWG